MLSFLQVRDFAIIDAVEVEFGAGMTALTGETGAGKSILVDAVILALGGRAAADTVRHGAERAEITATFDVAGNDEARAWLAEQSLDGDDRSSCAAWSARTAARAASSTARRCPPRPCGNSARC